MPTISYETRQKIKDQALSEIAWARDYKAGKTKNWQANERLYYGVKEQLDTSRSNLDLGKMQEFTHSFMSKIISVNFKYAKRKNSQLKRVARLNAIKTDDQSDDDWNIKDKAGDKQATIYGRAIFGYHADSVDGIYASHLENIDIYNYLIDPTAGGIDLEQAWYMGSYGVVKNRKELEDGMKGRSSLYLKTETARLLEGTGNSAEEPQEVLNTLPRTRDTNIWQTQKQLQNPDKYIFWQWYTTYEGERYYVLLNELGSTAIRIEKLSDIFADNMWPFWSWAPYVDLTEFWTPSPCDYAREPIMGQNVTLNQALDNNEQRNKPQKAIVPLAVKNINQLKYQRGGNFVEVDLQAAGITDIRQGLMVLEVPQINGAIEIYNLLDSIQEKASGVTAAAKGEADPNGKATIYEGNQAATADRFSGVNDAKSHGYKRFARLYENGVNEHLTKKRAIDILGPDGVEIENVTRRDIFKNGENFKVVIEASSDEKNMAERDKRTKIQFLAQNAVNPIQNPKKAYELQAQIVGLDEDSIRQLLDVSEFGDAELMSEADRDIEELLDGKEVKPNQAATSAYKQHFVDYMQDHEEDMGPDDIQRIFKYVDQLDDIIIRNTQRKLAEAQLMASINQPPAAPSSAGSPPGAPPVATGAPPAGIMPEQSPTANITGLIPNGA